MAEQVEGAGVTRLVASLICKDELGRYLKPCVEALLAFCDSVAVLDDGSADGGAGWLEAQPRVDVLRNTSPEFFAHEGRARNRLLDWTLTFRPTHILAVDADELVTNGPAIRAACEADEGPGAWSLLMEEVWKADTGSLWTREDGGWRRHPVPVLWRVPAARMMRTWEWRIADRQLACGRVPVAAARLPKAPATGASILHLGWACEADRAARHERYVEADGGRFHASAHLNSIMAPDRRVRLARRAWPEGVDREGLLERITRAAVAA